MPARPLIAAAVLAGFVASVQAQQMPPVTLKVGDPAPPLAVGKWLKGEPVKIEPGHVYVIDFWATWCGPCVASIPHVSELATKHTDVTFIGQNVFEQNPTAIDRFMEKTGETMKYHVASDDKTHDANGVIATTWMLASGNDTIPTAFIIDKAAKIAWIGRPTDDEFESVIEQVVAGTFDGKAIAEQKARQVALEKELTKAVREKRVDDALKASGELLKLKPANAEVYTMFEYALLSRNGRLDEARTRAAKIMETGKEASSFNAIAWSIAKRKDPAADDLKLARTAADKGIALSGGKQADYFDTSARLYAVEKNWAKAVETQKTAIELAEGDAKDELKAALTAYEKRTLPAAE